MYRAGRAGCNPSHSSQSPRICVQQSRAGLALAPGNAALTQSLARAQKETAETAEVQAQLFKMRSEKKKNAQMMNMLRASGLNFGNNININGPVPLGASWCPTVPASLPVPAARAVPRRAPSPASR